MEEKLAELERLWADYMAAAAAYGYAPFADPDATKALDEADAALREGMANAAPDLLHLARIATAQAARIAEVEGEGWQPIDALPTGEHVLLYWPKGERGGPGGMECATVYQDEVDGSLSYWTHGGPNAGSDWEPRNGEQPTHWRKLPPKPGATP